MDRALFDAFRAIAHDHAGIALPDGKETLVEARIGRRLRALGLPDARSYLHWLANDQSGDELISFLDAISTNFTSFFREPAHFDLLTAEARGWRDANAARVRVWCAASSSGEEPYTIAMILAQVFEGSGCDWKVLATDISTRILAAAEAGTYPYERLAEVPGHLRTRWFSRVASPAGEPELWQVVPALRSHIVFRRLNLAGPPFPMKGPFDAIFCRNVMIYFDAVTRQGFVHEADRLLSRGAPLFIGHAETLTGLTTRCQMIKPSVYRKVA